MDLLRARARSETEAEARRAYPERAVNGSLVEALLGVHDSRLDHVEW
jgi:hypothetical protein